MRRLQTVFLLRQSVVITCYPRNTTLQKDSVGSGRRASFQLSFTLKCLVDNFIHFSEASVQVKDNIVSRCARASASAYPLLAYFFCDSYASRRWHDRIAGRSLDNIELIGS